MKKEMTQEQRQFIDSLRQFLAENHIEQQEIAEDLGKTPGTVSRWMSCEYEIPKTSFMALKAFVSSRTKPSSQNVNSPPDDQFIRFKTSVLNYIMQHPSISEKSKVEVYNALQDFQLASITTAGE